MKINFKDYDLTNFHVNEGIFCGDYTTLVVPKMLGCNWTQDNKIFRSSIWDYEGNLVSAGLPKFTNFGENPEHFPVPKSLDNCIIVDKIDGSLCIMDYYKDTFSMRTRGTFSIDNAENVSDFHYCITKYPRIKEWIKQNSQHSLLCEITTPNQKIVIDYGAEPDFWLIGAVNKNDYSLMTQQELDNLSKLLGVKRPDYYQFSSMDSLLESIKKMIGKEGCCLYSKNQQYIHKIKSASYLIKHRFKSEATLENTLDLYFSYDKPSYQEFASKLTETFDYECFETVRGYASQVCDASKEVNKIINGFKSFIDNQLKSLSTRKEQAQKVISSYSESNRSSMIFTLLDGKNLTTDQQKKLFWQVLKK